MRLTGRLFRPVGELQAAAEAFRAQRQNQEARKAAEEKARGEHLAAIARLSRRYLLQQSQLLPARLAQVTHSQPQ